MPIERRDFGNQRINNLAARDTNVLLTIGFAVSGTCNRRSRVCGEKPLFMAGPNVGGVTPPWLAWASSIATSAEGHSETKNNQESLH